MRRWFAAASLGLAAATLSGCTSQQLADFLGLAAPVDNEFSDIQQSIDQPVAQSIEEPSEAPPSYPPPSTDSLSDAQLGRLRWCESTDNYRAISPGGLYRGAYQFDFRTWNSVAQQFYPFLLDLDPIDVEPSWQDAMARALFSQRGAEPWPVCGRLL